MLSVVFCTILIEYLSGPVALETGFAGKHMSVPPTATQKSHNLTVLTILDPEIVPEKTHHKIFLLAIISSSPQNIKQRNAIRQTWGKYRRQTGKIADLKWRTVFMMGQTFRGVRDREVEKEAEKHGDIIRGNYRDTYRGITTKLLMAYNWAAQTKYEYVFHGDDDIYVSFPNLIRWLTTTEKLPDRLYGGFVITGSVHRSKSHRHYVDRAVFAEDAFPYYCKGAHYVMSWKLLPSLVAVSRKVPRIHADDAYVGVLMREIGVQPSNIPGMKHRRLLTYFVKFLNSCYFQELIAIGDSLTYKQMYYVYRLVHNGNWFLYTRMDCDYNAICHCLSSDWVLLQGFKSCISSSVELIAGTVFI